MTSNDVDWIKMRITQAWKDHPSIPDAVATRIEILLSGEFAEKEISKSKLANIANTLMADMVTTQPKAVQ
jgi:hypothetical protein